MPLPEYLNARSPGQAPQAGAGTCCPPSTTTPESSWGS